MKELITISPGVGKFAENKDEARKIRLEKILPTLKKGKSIVIDFINVEYVTQSFIHTLVGEALIQYGDDVLDSIEFRNCSTQPQSVIELVVNYSLGGFPE